MPTYEYACKKCGEHLEVVQSFDDDALTACPSCGGQLRKVFGSIGIVFKGSGFYKTDSRSSRGKDGAAKSDGTAAKESTGAPKDGAAPARGSDSEASPSSGKPKASEAASSPGSTEAKGTAGKGDSAKGAVTKAAAS